MESRWLRALDAFRDIVADLAAAPAPLPSSSRSCTDEVEIMRLRLKLTAAQMIYALATSLVQEEGCGPGT